jgi:hypothetical protein
MVQMTDIPKNMQEDTISSFWTMLQLLESDAHCNKDPVLKHWVSQWYQQWNEITGDNKKPRWEAE